MGVGQRDFDVGVRWGRVALNLGMIGIMDRAFQGRLLTCCSLNRLM